MVDFCDAVGLLLQVFLVLLLELSHLFLLTALLLFVFGFLLLSLAKLLVPFGLFLDLASDFQQIGGLIVDLMLFREGLDAVLFLLLQSKLPL